MSAETISSEQIQRISDYLDDWDNVSFDDRRLVIDGLISSVWAASGDVQITWKI